MEKFGLQKFPSNKGISTDGSTGFGLDSSVNKSSEQFSVDGGDESRQAERRRRRFRKQKVSSADKDGDTSAASSTKRKNKRKEKKASLPDEEYDPYDSDPGESYRQHCIRANGMSTKSCLKFPNFLKPEFKSAGESETEMTSPPSPMASELGDVLGQTPASLPNDLTRVRYSLRSSITDGSEKQPSGPSVMERRELRPNNVHINVSHWSDSGARHYMEDR